MDEVVRGGAGNFERWNGKKWVRGVGDYDYGALIDGEREFGAGATNVVRMPLPEKEGRYRAVLVFCPASKFAPEFYTTLRFRVANYLHRRLVPGIWRPSQEVNLWAEHTSYRLYGYVVAASQPIQVSPANIQRIEKE